MPRDDRPSIGREHDLIGWCNPRCRRCHRTVIELAARPEPCRPVVLKAQLPAVVPTTDRRPA